MHNTFKRTLADTRAPTPLGTWLMSVSATCVEAVGLTGIGFVVVDMEHTPLDMAHLVDFLRALASTPTGVITRVPWNEPVVVKRGLDAGAQSVMFPMVQTPEEARAAVASTRTRRTAFAAWRPCTVPAASARYPTTCAPRPTNCR